MGTQQASFTVQASLSRHNSPRDARDEALWDLFKAEVRMLADDEKYEAIRLEMFG